MSGDRTTKDTAVTSKIWGNITDWRGASLGTNGQLLGIMEKLGATDEYAYSTDWAHWSDFADQVGSIITTTSTRCAIINLVHRVVFVTVTDSPAGPAAALIEQVTDERALAKMLARLSREDAKALADAVQQTIVSALETRLGEQTKAVDKTKTTLAEVNARAAV